MSPSVSQTRTFLTFIKRNMTFLSLLSCPLHQGHLCCSSLAQLKVWWLKWSEWDEWEQQFFPISDIITFELRHDWEANQIKLWKSKTGFQKFTYFYQVVVNSVNFPKFWKGVCTSAFSNSMKLLQQYFLPVFFTCCKRIIKLLCWDLHKSLWPV